MQNHDSGAKVYTEGSQVKSECVFPRPDRVFVIILSNSEKTVFSERAGSREHASGNEQPMCQKARLADIFVILWELKLS